MLKMGTTQQKQQKQKITPNGSAKTARHAARLQRDSTVGVGALLEGDETGRVCGANTGLAVANWLVADGELAKVVPHHLRLQMQCKGKPQY